MNPPGGAAPGATGYLPGLVRFNHSRRLDGVRGLAILMVLAGHIMNTQLAPLGVVVFFGLSGYLITSLLAAEKNRTGGIRLKFFYGRRMLRLYPALLVFLLAMLALRPLGLQLVMYAWFASLLYVRNIVGHGLITTHLWTLSMEEQFYLFWPLLVRRFAARRLAWLTLALIAAVTLARTLAQFFGVQGWVIGSFYISPFYRMDAILAGCLVALVAHSAWSARLAAGMRAISGNALILLLPIVAVGWALHANPEGLSFIAVEVLLCSVWLAVVVFSETTLAVRLLDLSILGWFGRYSYSIYLWQQLFLIDRPKFLGPFGRLPWNLFAAIVLGIASRHLVEVPFLKLKTKFFPEPAAGTAAVGKRLES